MTLKEMRIFCLAVIVVAGVLNLSAALLTGQHASESVSKADFARQALASNP